MVSQEKVRAKLDQRTKGNKPLRMTWGMRSQQLRGKRNAKTRWGEGKLDELKSRKECVSVSTKTGQELSIKGKSRGKNN